MSSWPQQVSRPSPDQGNETGPPPDQGGGSIAQQRARIWGERNLWVCRDLPHRISSFTSCHPSITGLPLNFKNALNFHTCCSLCLGCCFLCFPWEALVYLSKLSSGDKAFPVHPPQTPAGWLGGPFSSLSQHLPPCGGVAPSGSLGPLRSGAASQNPTAPQRA